MLTAINRWHCLLRRSIVARRAGPSVEVLSLNLDISRRCLCIQWRILGIECSWLLFGRGERWSRLFVGDCGWRWRLCGPLSGFLDSDADCRRERTDGARRCWRSLGGLDIWRLESLLRFGRFRRRWRDSHRCMGRPSKRRRRPGALRINCSAKGVGRVANLRPVRYRRTRGASTFAFDVGVNRPSSVQLQLIRVGLAVDRRRRPRASAGPPAIVEWSAEGGRAPRS